MKRNLHAFTLIEILIIISIVVLLIGLSLATYNNFTQEKNLDKEVNRLVDILSLARTKAQVSEVNPACPVGEEFVGFGVEVNASNYSLKQNCSVTVTNIQTYSFPANIRKISGMSQVNFYPLSAGATNGTINIQNNTIIKCLQITVSSTGVISTQSC